jgi:hypothetical protein
LSNALYPEQQGGIAGGSWSEIGLKKTSEFAYRTVKLNTNCDGPVFGVIAQPEHNIFLLQFWELYLVMKRTGETRP